MRFKLDENLPRSASDILRSQGHDVDTVHDEGLGGAPDQAVIDACRQEERILVTLDLDFSDIRSYPPASTPGIVVLKPPTQSFEHVGRLLARTVQLLNTEPVARRLWIVETDRVRIRE